MNDKIKKQLIISGVMVALLVSTLGLWYKNFVFHTYMDMVDYQYCFEGENDDIIFEGYEFYKNKTEQKHGGARLAAKTQNLFLNGDQAIIKFQLTSQSDKVYEYTHEYNITTDNEVFMIDSQETVEKLTDNDFSNVTVSIVLVRNGEEIYNESMKAHSSQLSVYNGSNKDYTLQNVYVASSWMKTGTISSTDDIAKKYPYMTMDYIILKDDGNVDNVDDYDRFIHLNGNTQDFIDGKINQTMIYDGTDSLLDKTIKCVITLGENESLEKPFIFMISLHGNIKAGDVNE